MVDISVIIPVYNVEKYLSNCIQSVISQSKKEMEIICINDGSMDESGKILDDFAAMDKRVRIVHCESNRGALLARKTGVDLANGRYIMFLDGDDFYAKDACEIAYNEIKRYNADILHFGTNVLNAGNVNLYEYDSVAASIRPYIGLLYDDNILIECFDKDKYNYSLWDKIYTTQLCKKVFSYISEVNCCMAEDMLLYFLFSYFAKSYAGIQNKIYNYNFAIGVTKPGTVDLEGLDKRCSSAKACLAIKTFLEEQGKYQQYEGIYKKIERRLLSDNFDVWYYRLPIDHREEGYNIFLKYWGAEKVILSLLYDIENKQFDINQKGRIIESKSNDIEVLGSKCEELLKELAAEKQRVDQLERHVLQSWSYKVGRGVTWIPRKIAKCLSVLLLLHRK